LITGILKALRELGPYWVGVLIIALGIYNIIGSIIAIPSRGLILSILTSEVVQASSFLEIIVGLILTLLGYGIYQRYRAAMQIVLILLSISIILNALQVNPIGIGFSVIMILIVYSGREKYRRGLQFHLNIQYIAVFWAVSIASLYGIIGSLFYGNEFAPPIDNYIKAFYYTVTTITTVGYGDIAPASDNARLFTSSLIIIGVAVFLSATLLIGETLIQRLDKISKRVREEDKLKDSDSKDQQ